ncbi:MAG TPA: hypothetical protein DD471_08205, partial [Planctomycetes bacterium]|nr:hypothetical protein [Planctomycetota bacterium]
SRRGHLGLFLGIFQILKVQLVFFLGSGILGSDLGRLRSRLVDIFEGLELTEIELIFFLSALFDASSTDSSICRTGSSQISIRTVNGIFFSYIQP